MERPFRTTHLFEKRGDSGLRVPSERPSVILAGRWAGHDLEANLRPSYVLCLDLSSPVLVLCWQASDFRERIIPVDDLRFTFGGFDFIEWKVVATSGFEDTAADSLPCRHDVVHRVKTQIHSPIHPGYSDFLQGKGPREVTGDRSVK